MLSSKSSSLLQEAFCPINAVPYVFSFRGNPQKLLPLINGAMQVTLIRINDTQILIGIYAARVELDDLFVFLCGFVISLRSEIGIS